jgi:hypothetical protein
VHHNRPNPLLPLAILEHSIDRSTARLIITRQRSKVQITILFAVVLLVRPQVRERAEVPEEGLGGRVDVVAPVHWWGGVVGGHVGAVVVFAIVRVREVSFGVRGLEDLGVDGRYFFPTYQSGWLYWLSLELSRATSAPDASPVGAARVEATKAKVEAKVAKDFMFAVVLVLFSSLEIGVIERWAIPKRSIQEM